MDLSRLKSIDCPSDFTEPVSIEHAAMYADAVVLLLVDGGFEQVAMAPVARRIRQVPSAVKQLAGGRAGFLEIVTRRLGRRWLRWADHLSDPRAMSPRLPRAGDEIHGVRVWSLLREIAAGEARAGRTALADIVAQVDAEERSAMLARFRRAGRPLTEAEAVLVSSVAIGLRARMTAAVAPMTAEDADRALDLLGRWLGLSRSD